MKDEQINTGIAKALGWSNHTIDGITYWWHDELNKTLSSNDDGFRPLPDYCNDLNAIHTARNSLTPDQQKRYIEILLGYDIADFDGAPDWSAAFDLHNKKPRECAEAFLRTLGLWKN